MAGTCRTVSLLVGLLLLAGCARGMMGPPLDTPVRPAPRPLDSLTLAERFELMDRAEVWRRIDTRRLDLLRGPHLPDGFAFQANVTCTFNFPDEPLSGTTRKFECRLAPGDTVKVKYGEDNGEVFAEVAASRLLWALGFLADRMYPVKVWCLDCPANPHRVSTSEWRLGRPGNVTRALYDLATIERKFPGVEIEVPGFEGWSWQELEVINLQNRGAPRAHVDALKLLAVFIQHVDSKPEQQALICPYQQVGRDRRGNATCDRPVLVIKDLGSTFGAARKLSYDKMELESWRSAPIWKDAQRCRGNLARSFVGTLEHPIISEQGRSFLAERLDLLSDEQLYDLFTAARVERRDETIEGRVVTVGDWVRVFKEKRAQVRNHRCR